MEHQKGLVMKLILVESSKKAKLVNERLRELDVHYDFHCSFTCGRLFDYKVTGASSLQVRNREVVNYLETVIARCDSVIAMTDADEQGEYIAYQVAVIADKFNKEVMKGDLIELTTFGVKKSLSNLRAIDIKTVQKAHSERLVNLKIAQMGIANGYGAVGIPELMTAEYLTKNNLVEVGSVTEHGNVFNFLTRGGKASAPKHVPVQPPSTFDIILNSMLQNKSDVVSICDEFQELYESGLLSYARTPSNEWLPDAVGAIEELVSACGYLVDHQLIQSNCSVDIPHSALYIVEPKSLGLRLNSLNLVSEWTLATLDRSEYRTYTSDVPYPIISNLSSADLGPKKVAQSQVQTFLALKDLDLYKPSTGGAIAKKLANRFFNGPHLSVTEISKARNYTSKEFPELRNFVQQRQNPLNELINSEIKSSNLEVGNKIAETAFEALTHRGF